MRRPGAQNRRGDQRHKKAHGLDIQVSNEGSWQTSGDAHKHIFVPHYPKDCTGFQKVAQSSADVASMYISTRTKTTRRVDKPVECAKRLLAVLVADIRRRTQAHFCSTLPKRLHRLPESRNVQSACSPFWSTTPFIKKLNIRGNF
jgi:hypothetical protein